MKIREVVALRDAILEGGPLDEVAPTAMHYAQGLDPQGLAEMQAELGLILRAFPPERTHVVALIAGAIVEFGGAPEDLPGVIYDRLAEMREARDPAEDEALPECFYPFEQAAMAALSRSPGLRRTLPQRARLLACEKCYEDRYGFLGKMLAVLDDEPLYVVDVPTGRAWRLRIGGVADNFQLHTLLRGALAGDGPDRIAGEAPDPAALAESIDAPVTGAYAMRSRWQLSNGFALLADGKVDSEDYQRNWIWNEGVPEDIAVLDGARVVLIEPGLIERSWNAGRVFQGMPGRLDVEARLTDAEAKALLRSLIAAGAAMRAGERT
ncbi:MAG: hypothetical protein R3A52_00950 [Polyangiales bacterium]